MSVWDEVVGQADAVAQFQRAAADPALLAQAWLITGPPGSGRSTAARAFAATLQCEQGIGCGHCRACTTVAAGSHPDVEIVATDKLSISKDEIRALVLTAQRSPAVGRHRILIIEDADRMTDGTFNVLLKSIEEPPPATVWMLCAPSAEDLAPTIRSRCRVVTLAVPAADVVAELLVRRDGVEPELALRAARSAQGHIGLAKRYALQQGALEAREATGRTLLELRTAGAAVVAAGQLIERATTEAKEHADAVAQEERAAFLSSAGLQEGETVPPALRSQLKQVDDAAKRRQSRLIRDVLDRYLLDVHSVLRDVLALQLDSGQQLVNPGIADAIGDAAQRGTPQGTVDLVEAVQRTRQRIDANVAPQLAVEALLTRVATTLT